MSTPWRINHVMDYQPCRPDCPDRTWECKRTCPKWLAYEAHKQEVYAKRLEIHLAYDYTSHMAVRVNKRRVTDYKQGRRR